MRYQPSRLLGIIVLVLAMATGIAYVVQVQRYRGINETKRQLRVALDDSDRLSKDNPTFLQQAKGKIDNDPDLTPTLRNFRHGFLTGFESLLTAKPSDFTHPRVLAVNIVETDYDGKPCIEMVLYWLSSEAVTDGVYIQDAGGKIISKGSIRTTEGSGEVGYLQLGSSYLSKIDDDVGRIEIDPKYLDENLRVGLVEKDGTLSKPVQAYIAPELAIRLRELTH